MTIRAPSIKTLCALLKDVDIVKAKEIRRVIKGDRATLLTVADELDEHHRGIDYQELCYLHHSPRELKAVLLDQILGTYGVEYMFKGSDGLRSDPESQHDYPICTYLNAGDTYAMTIMYYRRRWQIACWGYIAEKYL